MEVIVNIINNRTLKNIKIKIVEKYKEYIIFYIFVVNMLFQKKLLRIYKVPFAVFLFLFSFTLFHWIKPSFAYQPNGAYRQFGVGYKHKTVIPIWVVAIIFSIMSYLIILSVIQIL